MVKKGDFTLPGEAGYEDLTLELAKKWGADVIRDSDGTVLSDKITSSGYDIYSTLCMVRSDNKWAKENMDKLQQNYLMSFPVTADQDILNIDILKGYFREQFVINTKDNPSEWWQVFNRTTGIEIPKNQWKFESDSGMVTINNTVKWHNYTVNFLVYRIWEEISMYNHITNNWGDREHLMAVEPIYPETQEHILKYLENWLIEHPKTNVVRFTSMFYNFCWFWGDNPNLRYIYSDWASYDFTVNPYSMKEFEKMYGYRITSEDFVNKGLYNSTHNVPSKRYRDWMDFINRFVVSFGKKCIDLVHKFNKKAYVFYDDHWVGVEPYGKRFKDFNFDGIIKAAFSGFEARLVSGVKGAKTHELRLHPYLFPTGLKGEPTFKDGGDPTLDCKNFWVNIRRALLRECVDRIGFGGYLHLVKDFPDFIQYVEELSDEFRLIKDLHKKDKPYSAPFKIAILTAWGNLRSWTCSGHLHEHPELDLIHIIESLSGQAFVVEFISFDDIIKNEIPSDIKVIINAGRYGSAWIGGEYWANPIIIEKITGFVAEGGGFIGVGEPSAFNHSSQYFQLSHILGVERETGLSIAKIKYNYKKHESHFITENIIEGIIFDNDIDNIYATGDSTIVLKDKMNSPNIALNTFNNGRTVYFSGYRNNPINARLLYRSIYWASGNEDKVNYWSCSNPYTECAYFPGNKKLIVINNSNKKENTEITTAGNKRAKAEIDPFGIRIIDIN